MTDEQLAELERDAAWLVQHVAPDVSSRAEDSIWRVDGAVRALVAEVRRLRAAQPSVKDLIQQVSAAAAVTPPSRDYSIPAGALVPPFEPAHAVTFDDGFVAPPPHVVDAG
jgi:hypothetical protein